MDIMDKNQAEIDRKQKKLGKLPPKDKEVYQLVMVRISAMSIRKRIKLLRKKSAVDKLIAEVREELNG